MPVVIPKRRRDLRFDVALVNGGRLELALDDQVGLGEALATSPFSKCRCTGMLVGVVPILPISLVNTLSCNSGASSFIASRTHVTAGSGSYSTRISLSALRRRVGSWRRRQPRRAPCTALVMRQAIGAQVGQVDRAFAQVAILSFKFGKSRPVATANTPGSFSAAWCQST